MSFGFRRIQPHACPPFLEKVAWV
ncbi:unnamed protein product [Spirodela intermedia]|uniref:Uncharacterized protein n=1 Tax=Spirodela intermedia TaxID=51605 RepID=A0A7I8JLD8_SPIIN|nr:unnamed protein product [Spirodela intermedia]CAA6670986.1 unnamed protein product [Spirodela intermedia]